MVSDSSSTTTSYCSTRGGAKGVSFEDVVLGGLAEDRGLYVPEELPTVSAEELSEVKLVCCGGAQGRFQGLLQRSGVVSGRLERMSRCAVSGSRKRESSHVTHTFVIAVQRTRSNFVARTYTYIRTLL